MVLCEEMPKVEHTAVCSEMDVDVACQVFSCLTKHDAEEDGEQCGGQDAILLDLDAVWRWGSCPTMTHCASSDLADPHGAGVRW